MFVAHPTVRLKGSEHLWEPIICRDENCENRDHINHVHCPLCQNEPCSTDLAYIKMHFRVKHVDEGLDCKTGFYSLKCHRHCKITNLRKEKLLEAPHWHCFRCRNAFIRKDDLINHHLSHRVHKNNGKGITHVVVQKDINQGMTIERNSQSYEVPTGIHPGPVKVPEFRQPLVKVPKSWQPPRRKGHVPILPNSCIIHTITAPPPPVRGIQVTNQSLAIINRNDEFSLSERKIIKDNVGIQIVATQLADVVQHSEAAPIIINSNLSQTRKKNQFVFLRKDVPTSIPSNSTVASKKEPSISSQNNILVKSKKDICETSQSLPSRDIISQPKVQNCQHLVSVINKSSELNHHSVLHQGTKSRLSSADTQQPSDSNEKHSSICESESVPAKNVQTSSPQNNSPVPLQNEKHLSPTNTHNASPCNDGNISTRTDEELHPGKGSSSKNDHCLSSKEKEGVPSVRDEPSLPRDHCPPIAKNKEPSHMECINQKLILVAEKKQLENGLETAQKDNSDMADTIRGMNDAISHLREENKDMSQKLSKLAEENFALRRQLNVITSAIFPSEPSERIAEPKTSSTPNNKSYLAAGNKTTPLNPQPINLISEKTSYQRTLQVMSQPVIRMKSILPPATVEEEEVHQALIGQELQTSLGGKATTVANVTEDKSKGRSNLSKKTCTYPSVLHVEKNCAKNKSNETVAKCNPSKNYSIFCGEEELEKTRKKSLDNVLEENFSTTAKQSESLVVDKSGVDAASSTGTSEQGEESLLAEVFEAELEIKKLKLYSKELEKEFLSSNMFSSSESSAAASPASNSIDSFSYASKDNNVSPSKFISENSLERSESTLNPREGCDSPSFINSADSLLEMFTSSDSEQSLGNVIEYSFPPSVELFEGESDLVSPSLTSSMLISPSENSGQAKDNISQEIDRIGDTNLTMTESCLISSRFEVSPLKDFDTYFFGNSEDFSKPRSLSDVLRLDENLDLPQVSDEFGVLDKCFESDVGEKNSSGYSVCPLSAFLDDDNFLFSIAKEGEQNRGRKRFLESDGIGTPNKRK